MAHQRPFHSSKDHVESDDADFTRPAPTAQVNIAMTTMFNDIKSELSSKLMIAQTLLFRQVKFLQSNLDKKTSKLNTANAKTVILETKVDDLKKQRDEMTVILETKVDDLKKQRDEMTEQVSDFKIKLSEYLALLENSKTSNTQLDEATRKINTLEVALEIANKKINDLEKPLAVLEKPLAVLEKPLAVGGTGDDDAVKTQKTPTPPVTVGVLEQTTDPIGDLELVDQLLEPSVDGGNGEQTSNQTTTSVTHNTGITHAMREEYRRKFEEARNRAEEARLDEFILAQSKN